MGLIKDKSNPLYALPEGVTLVDWLDSVLNDTLSDLKKITPEIINSRSTLNEITGLKTRIQNADKKTHLIQEQEVPKLDTAADIRRIDNKVTLVKQEISRIRNLLVDKGYYIKLIEDL